MTAENDSSDLEALFDSIASSAPAETAPEPAAGGKDDSDDLQALFDSVSADYTAPAAPPPVAVAAPAPAPAPAAAPATGDEVASGTWPVQEAVFQRIGHMARQLHDTIRELGYDKVLEKTVTAIPDAKDRLAYVANLTEQAA
ncbi:MAG TPA: protein phosphatase CheZ, partial [Rhodocyclaceae bacterium]|nr:protein phosphatase CheZ [Rhodocyclaceae bacterium]